MLPFVFILIVLALVLHVAATELSGSVTHIPSKNFTTAPHVRLVQRWEPIDNPYPDYWIITLTLSHKHDPSRPETHELVVQTPFANIISNVTISDRQVFASVHTTSKDGQDLPGQTSPVAWALEDDNIAVTFTFYTNFRQLVFGRRSSNIRDFSATLRMGKGQEKPFGPQCEIEVGPKAKVLTTHAITGTQNFEVQVEMDAKVSVRTATSWDYQKMRSKQTYVEPYLAPNVSAVTCFRHQGDQLRLHLLMATPQNCF